VHSWPSFLSPVLWDDCLAAAAGLLQRCSIGGVVAGAEKPTVTDTFLPEGCLKYSNW
jgi:hypothetical protein